MPSCSAYGCASSTRFKGNWEKGIFFHKFPNREKSPERHQIWIDYCNRVDFVPGTKLKSACLCSKHFNQTDLSESQLLKIKLMPGANLRGPRLKAGAIPTVALSSVVQKRRSNKVPRSVPIFKFKRNELNNYSHLFDSALTENQHLSDENNSDTSFMLQNDSQLFKRRDVSIQCELGMEVCRTADAEDDSNSTTEIFESDSIHGDITISDDELDDNDSSFKENHHDNRKDDSFAAWGNLLLLFRICNVCSSEVNDIRHEIRGDKVCVKSLCSCGNKVTWTSQPSKKPYQK